MTVPASRRLEHGLRWRVVVGMVAAALISLVLLAVAGLLVARRELVANARRTAVEETRAALTLVDRELPSPTVEAVADLTADLRAIGAFDVVAAVGDDVTRSDPRLGPADVPPELQPPTATPRIAATETALGPSFVTATRAAGRIDLYLFFSRSSLERDLSALTRAVLLTALATGVVMVGGTLTASRRLFRPVDETAEAARQLAAGVLRARAPEQPGSFTDLTDAFNDMAEALEQTIERLREMEAGQRRFVADVSHELRTPMTALSTAADLVEPGLERLEGPQRRAAEMLISEVRRLRKMVEDLMEISRLDEGVEPALEPIEVARLVRRLVARHGWSADVSLSMDAPEDVSVLADPRRLHGIVRNLIENAREHGRPPVRVTVTCGGGRVFVDVADDGPGVPDGDRDRIFERFHKADAARTRTGGSGLGLAIARSNARLMGGEVRLLPGPGGARFRVELAEASDPS